MFTIALNWKTAAFCIIELINKSLRTEFLLLDLIYSINTVPCDFF